GGHRVEHPSAAIRRAALRAFQVRELPQRWLPEIGATKHLLLEEPGEAAGDRQSVPVDWPVPPGTREAEVTPSVRCVRIGTIRNCEDRAQLRERQPRDGIALVHEHDECVVAIANVETARHHIDTRRRVAKHLFECRYLGQPYLASHEREIATAGVQSADRRRRAHEVIIEAHIGLGLPEALLPGAHERPDEVTLAVISTVSPNADGPGELAPWL